MKRVGILALLHESNTFIAEPTTLRYFEENVLLTGEAVRKRFADTHHELGGFFDGLREAGCDAVPIFAARAVPYGTITAETYEVLLDRMLRALDGAGRLDGILAAPHGATVSERVADVDGHWLECVRQRIGPGCPLIGTLDPHANLSRQMVGATDALVAYRSNPHLDQRARGLEAANLMARTLRGEVRPTQAAAFPPLAINIERQLTSEPQCRPLYELADSQLQRPRVLSNSIFLGFPYADVAEMGSAVLAVTDQDPPLAETCAAELARYLWEHREEFAGQLTSIDEALAVCETSEGPVCLLDMGDNAGGGSPADSTHLAHAIRRRHMVPAFVCLYDPVAVGQAAEAGQDAVVRLRVGGKTDHLHGEPLEDEFTVLGVYDGKFHEPEPRHGGFTHCDQGPTAVVRGKSGITCMLTSRRMPPFSIRQLTTFGVEPRSFRVLVAKGVNAPVAAYQPVCTQLIRVNTPGCTTADMTMLDFRHRRRPMFPFERDTRWDGPTGKGG
ncbi:MAG: M81 family metallopeptidase [Pirellulaceae bacterium]